MKNYLPILVTSLALSSPALSQSVDEKPLTTEQAAFFESKIRPLFAEYCYKCHSSEEKIKGGLTLNTRAGTVHGGDSGVAIVPGDAEASLIYQAVTWSDSELEMPPKQKLPASKIADLRKWIEMGAPDPRKVEEVVLDTEIDVEKGKQFWSFQKPKRVAAPKVKDQSWPKSNTDRFVLAKLEAADLKPAAAARPDQLLRRLYFDLIGLPPTPQEIVAYGKAWDKDPEAAYQAKVDELLASRHFGERWGRHWLDVARYAESTGKEINMPFPHAWRFRDYVIKSFNEDKPYDRFIMEQIAGDLLKIKSDAEWQDNLIATGFLAIGTKGLNERDPRQFALDLADEQIDTTTQAFLGITASCARCHDHKTDPIPTTDYYALSGIFQSTKTYFGTVNVITNRRGTKLLELPVADKTPTATASQTELEFLRERIADTEEQLVEAQLANRRAQQAGGNPVGNNIQNLLRLRTTLAQMRARLNSFDKNGVAKTVAMGVQEHEFTVEPAVLIRGEVDKPAQKVSRGFLQVLEHAETPKKIPAGSSGRLELARSIASKENPLTARVMVNRIWAQLFGQGIVPSTSNFGDTGQRPSNPELLDHLALQFMDDGWSVKSIIRKLVNTRSYQMGTGFNSTAFTKDPDNQLLWRMSPRRLDAEALRDSMLYASGNLDTRRPVGSIVTGTGRLNPALSEEDDGYRSVYLPIVRDALPESLALFDVADPSIVSGEREETNVPGQALYLMNNPFVIEQAEALAQRLLNEGDNARERFERAFMLCYGRAATEAEIDATREFFSRFESAAGGDSKDQQKNRLLAFTTFCQSLFASAEFRYLN